MSSDEASILSDIENENDLEVIQEGGDELENNLENNENQVEEGTEQIEREPQEQDDENATKKQVKPQRVIRNPQPKLNEQTLKGARGLGAIESYFERVTFKGRGYEEQDLNVLMKTYEYWCHRLFPKFPFDDCIARLEKLGVKKATQTHIKRIRMGIDIDDDKPLVDTDEENENDTAGFVDTHDEFDNLLPNTVETVPEISEEQLQRMRQNRERAEKLRQERLRQIREKAKSSLEESSQLSVGNNQLNSNENSQLSKNMFGESSQSNSNIIEENQNNWTPLDVTVDEDIFSQENEMRENIQKQNEEDSEDDIDNILDYINKDEDNTIDNSTASNFLGSKKSIETDINRSGGSEQRSMSNIQNDKSIEPFLGDNEINAKNDNFNKKNVENESEDHMTSNVTNEENFENANDIQRNDLGNLPNTIEDNSERNENEVPMEDNVPCAKENVAAVVPEESMDIVESL